MPNAEMKTLTIGDTTYEIVDEEARESVGDLFDLTTQEKTDLVSAINEVAESAGHVDSVNGMTGTVVLTAADVGAATTGALTDETTARTAADAQLQGQITALGNGAPIPVSTIAAMTEQTKVYLYTGSETGESTGYWYSYDSAQSKFVPRGEYGAGVIIDNTLTIPNAAAGAEATGQAIDGLDDRLTDVESSLSGDITMSLTWERGNINSSGENANNLRTIRTPLPLIPVDVDTLTLTFDGSYSTDPIVSVYCYQADGTFISPAINKTASATVALPTGTAFVRFKLSFGSSDTTTVIDPAEGNDILQVKYFTSINSVQLANEVEGKLNTNAGETNAGKILRVGGDGMIVPVDSASTEKAIYMEWERGNISSSGNNSGSTSTKYIRNKYRYEVVKATNNLHVPTGMTVRVFVYNTIAETSDAFVEYTGGYTADTVITLTEGTFIRLVAFYTNNDDIAISDGDAVGFSYGITDQEFYNDYTNKELDDYSALSMFKTIGIIGDSWASGSIHIPTGYVATDYSMSWGQILARKLGIKATNYSKGGLSTKTWLADTTYGLSALLADTAKQCYLINLGINDNTQIKAGTLTLGTIADVDTEDYTQNPDTFFGDYGRIIGNIKEHAPEAIIFLLSVARPNERNMDTYIAQIAEKYGLPFIHLPDDDYFVSGYFYGSIYDGHMAAFGYSGMAQAIERLLQKYVITHRAQFASYWSTQEEDEITVLDERVTAAEDDLEDINNILFVSSEVWVQATIAEDDSGEGYYYTDGAYHSDNRFTYIAYQAPTIIDIYATSPYTSAFVNIYSSDTFNNASLVTSISKQVAGLPTADNPLTVQAGNWIVLSHKSATYTQAIYYAETQKTVKKPYTGKVWAAVGDSWTAVNSYATVRYHDFIAQDLGITVGNYGVSGTGYTKDGGITGKEFYNRVTDLGTPDVVTIFGSGNDCTENMVIGEITDTTPTTICGAINYTISQYLTAYPNTPLGIVAPAPWRHDGFYPANPNSRMTTYVDAMEAICKRRGVPFLDLYRCSSLFPEIEADRTTEQKVYYNTNHINEKGQKLIYPKIRAFLETLI